MTVDSITSSLTGIDALNGGSTQETAKAEDPMGKDAFLTMLIAQLQHQDPLNPMEGSDFSSQLAQFSSLEQLFDINDNLKVLQTTMGADSQDNLLDYIGKEVSSKSDVLELSGGRATEGAYSLESEAQVVISIFDASGREIRRLYPGQVSAGTHSVNWDGYDQTGSRAADGVYSFGVTAVGSGGGRVAAQTTVNGLVTGITYQGETPYLVLGDRFVKADSIVSVRIPTGDES